MFVQIIDVRDMAAWVARSLKEGRHSTFNVVGHPGALTFGDVVQAADTRMKTEGNVTYVPGSFLSEHRVGPWVEMPLCVPDLFSLRGLKSIHNCKARATVLTIRSFEETVRDTLAEFRKRPPTSTLPAGLAPEREMDLLPS